MLVLSSLPCGDTDECNENNPAPIATKASSHDRHDDDTENCTPFCICACCATAIIYQPLAAFKISAKLFPTIYNPAPETDYVSQVSVAIWQPPKVTI